MAYLITGGTGFLGSYVVRDLLKKGIKDIVCLQRSGITQVFRDIAGAENADKIKVIQGDIGDTVWLFNVIRDNNIDIIIHLGFVLEPVASLQPAYALKVNCIGINNMLEAVRLFKLKRLVWTSSSRCFGNLGETWTEPVGGDDALYMPDDCYGATKALDEFMMKLYYNKFGVDSITVRMARSFGIGKWTGGGATVSQFIKECALNIPTTIGGAHHVTPWQYIEDTADLVIKSCEVLTTKSRIFNTGEELSISQMVEIIRKINPEAKVTVEERLGVGKVFVPASHPKIDISTTEAEIGWTPKYSIEGGLRLMMNYFRRQEGMSEL
ncbi:NAD-dependent epimerase/dehydratase family protein [Chloroflexota bacterium]